MTANFDLKPIGFNWVALHPQPIGVVQFIGGAFFGTFPTLFYRSLLQQCYEQGYTVIALPFRFTFRHWSVAIDLIEEQIALRAALIEEAKRLGYASEIYEIQPQDQAGKYLWMGHSLGCKYIAMLEILSDLETQETQIVLANTIGQRQYQQIQDKLARNEVALEQLSIKGQPSLLLAPTIADFGGAIPIPALAHFIENRLGLQVLPTVEQTHQLIQHSNLFNLTGLVSFELDNIAASTIAWLKRYLSHKAFQPLFGDISRPAQSIGHLTPLGFRQLNDRLRQEAQQFLIALQERAQATEPHPTQTASDRPAPSQPEPMLQMR